MEQRIIPLKIKDEFISGAGVSVGAVGSHDDVLLEMDFRDSPAWTGTTRRVIFSNALGENRTPILLTIDLLEEGQSEVYLVPVPAEAKEVAGECFLTVEGFIGEGELEKVRIVTEEATFRVLPSRLYSNDNPSLTPTEAEQLQKEVDAFKESVAQVNTALTEIKESADAAATSALDAEAWACGTREGEAVPEEDPAHENNSKWWSSIAEAAKTAAEAARASIEALQVTASTLEAGKPATASVELTEDIFLITFGLPKGDTGASIQKIERTAGTGTSGTTDTYTITLTDGSKSAFEVYNGKDGSVIFEDLTEAQRESLRGPEGYTPVRGTDYWTEKDKEEIVNDTIDLLEESEFGSGVTVEKVWENISPTSTFATQTAKVTDSSQYAVLIVEFSCAAERGNTRASCVLTDVGSAVTVTTFNEEAKMRSATRVSSGVNFSNAFCYPQGVEAQDNLRLIPQKIYGIKGEIV